MSPLLLVGITIISTALGDVKHILEGATPREINALAQANNAAFQSGNPQDFWWMASNSPFKQAYDHYKKCSLKGNCGNVAETKVVASGGATAFASSGSVGGNIDIKNNPFLNGDYQSGKASSSATIKTSGFHSGATLDLSKNPFLNGKYAHNNLGEKIFNENGFLGVQPSKPFATNHPLNNKKPFGQTHPAITNNVSGQKGGATCEGRGYLCVAKETCHNGVVNVNGEGLLQVRSDSQVCKDNEVCCRVPNLGPEPDKINLNLPPLDGKTSLNVNNLNQVTAGKSSVPGSTIKFSGGAGLSPGQVHVIQDQSIDPQILVAGESGHYSGSVSTVKPRDVSDNSLFGSSTVDYSNTNFEDVRFASTIQGPAYLPPIGTPPPTKPPLIGVPDIPTVVIDKCAIGQIRLPSGGCGCGPGQIKLPSGQCGYPTTPRPSCPPGEVLLPGGQCGCASGQIRLPSGGCGYPPPPTTPRPSCPPGEVLLPGGQCGCASGQIRLPSGGCGYPPPPTTPRPSCPPGEVLLPGGQCGCASGQIRLPSGGCGYPPPPTTPRPSCPPGEVLLPGGNCGCASGQIRLPSGGCGYPPPPTTPRPSCPPGEVLLPGGQCGCASGQIRLPSGGCGYPPPPTTPRPSCPPGEVLLPGGQCGCASGQIRLPSGGCGYPPTPTPSCAPGQIRNVQGICEYVRTPTPTPPRDYLPPITPPTATPPPPPSPTGGYTYNTPTPAFTYPTTASSSERVIDIFTPGPQDKDPSGSNDIQKVIVPRPDRPQNNVSTLPGCAAALKCVEESFCTAEGVVSATQVILTREQQLNRVPTTDCHDIETGITGKCCRDPNYKDPWPSANLVNGVDNGQYKEDNFYGQNNIRPVRSDTPVATRSIASGQIKQQLDDGRDQCGLRNKNTQPVGQSPIDVNFAEIPWQAMILRDSNRSLLCGGAIIRQNAVLTAAHCVEGLDTRDVLVKGGEWKLGIDEEPLPFQIVKVAAIVRHPQYVHGSLVNDLAVLILEEKLRPTKNVGTICLPEPNQIPTQNCIATGWGKRILQLHAKNALMHSINVKIMDTQQCQQTLAEKFKDSVQNYSPNTLCGFSDVDQCKVDYGSALACPNANGHYTLSGIYGWDTGCKGDGQIGGYVAPDVEWIQGCFNKPLKELKRLDREYNSKASN